MSQRRRGSAGRVTRPNRHGRQVARSGGIIASSAGEISAERGDPQALATGAKRGQRPLRCAAQKIAIRAEPPIRQTARRNRKNRARLRCFGVSTGARDTGNLSVRSDRVRKQKRRGAFGGSPGDRRSFRELLRSDGELHRLRPRVRKVNGSAGEPVARPADGKEMLCPHPMIRNCGARRMRAFGGAQQEGEDQVASRQPLPLSLFIFISLSTEAGEGR